MKRTLASFAMLCVLWVLACSNKKGDPPPPVGSGTLPMAPPGATGALAAGREETSRSAPIAPQDGLDDEDEDPGGPLVPAPSPPDDGGMAL